MVRKTKTLGQNKVPRLQMMQTIVRRVDLLSFQLAEGPPCHLPLPHPHPPPTQRHEKKKLFSKISTHSSSSLWSEWPPLGKRLRNVLFRGPDPLRPACWTYTTYTFKKNPKQSM